MVLVVRLVRNEINGEVARLVTSLGNFSKIKNLQSNSKSALVSCHMSQLVHALLDILEASDNCSNPALIYPNMCPTLSYIDAGG